MLCCCRPTANSRLPPDCWNEDETKALAWARVVGHLLLDGWMMMRRSDVVTDVMCVGAHSRLKQARKVKPLCVEFQSGTPGHDSGIKARAKASGVTWNFQASKLDTTIS